MDMGTSTSDKSETEETGIKLYKASAGSGKTYTLAKEYITLLLKDANISDNYRHILAITFTKKATAEMKDRILANLDLIDSEASDKESDKKRNDYINGLAEVLKISKEEIIRRARRVNRNLLHDYSHFQIETIDSFFQKVLRNLAYEVGIGSSWNLELDEDAVMQDTIQALFDKLGDDKNLKKWISDYITLKMESGSSWNIKDEIAQFGKNIFKEKFATNTEMQYFLEGKDKEGNPIEVDEKGNNTFDLKKKIAEEKNRLQSQLDELRKPIKEAVDEFYSIVKAYGLDTSSDLKRGIGTYFHDKKDGGYGEAGSFTLKCIKPDNPSSVFSGNMVNGSDEVDRRIKDCINKCEEQLKKYRTKIASLTMIIDKLDEVGLLGDINNTCHEILKEQNLFMLSMTQPLLNKFVQRVDAPFIYEKIGVQLHYIMIDEFQDTSRTQFSNFKPLIINCCAEHDGSLLVGDPKQAIYRFRNGDWELIQNIGKELPECHIKQEQMGNNYRSAHNIINFNNALFGNNEGKGIRINGNIISGMADYEKTDEGQDGHLNEIYKGSEQECQKEENGCVRVVFMMPDKKEKNNEEDDNDSTNMEDMVLQSVLYLKERKVKEKDILILVRKNKYIPGIARYLTAKGEKVVSSEAFQLEASSKVRLMMDCLRYLFASYKWADKKKDLEEQFHQEEIAADYFRCVCRDKADSAAKWTLMLTEWNSYVKKENAELTDGIRELALKLERLKKEAAPLPLYDMAEKIYLIMIGEQRTDAYVQTFLNEVNRYASRHTATLDGFINYWDEKLSTKSIPIDEKDQNGIHIMSIHKSKGLEGHSVIIPYCEWDSADTRMLSRDELWCEGNKSDTGCQIPLVPISGNKNMAYSCFKNDRDEEIRQENVDSINTLYVALTRARMNLIVLSEKALAMDNQDKKDMKDKEFVPIDYLLYQCLSGSENFKKDENPFNGSDVAKENGKTMMAYYGLGEVEASKDENDTKDLSTSEERDSYANRGYFKQSSKAKAFIKTGSDELSISASIANGNLHHALLSEIESIADLDHPEAETGMAVHHLIAQGLTNEDEAQGLIGQADKYIEQLNLTHHDLAHQWFDADNTVHNECNILLCDHDGEDLTERPDRVVFSPADGSITVIDYKTGRQLKSHSAQVLRYMNLIRQMNLPKVTTIKGYLWYLNSGEVLTVQE
jgi:ATP-dependent helicase/nuclease subunit A